MANLTFDLSNESILHPKGENTGFVFKDIGTDNIKYHEDNVTGKLTLNSVDSSNFDATAVKASLRNILSFRNGEQPLDPEFGISKILGMLYAPFDKYTTQKMINTLKGIISYYEPRIEILSLPTTYDEDNKEYQMTINYYIPRLQLNDSYQVTLNQ